MTLAVFSVVVCVSPIVVAIVVAVVGFVTVVVVVVVNGCAVLFFLALCSVLVFIIVHVFVHVFAVDFVEMLLVFVAFWLVLTHGHCVVACCVLSAFLLMVLSLWSLWNIFDWLIIAKYDLTV